jgi:hypothetical protein
MPRVGIYAVIALMGPLAYQLAVSPEWQASIGAVVLAVVRPVVIPAVELINAPGFVYVASTLIMFAAVAASVAYWVRVVRPGMRRFAAVRRAVRDLPLPVGADRDRVGEPIHRLGDVLRQAGLFLTAWASFQGEVHRDGCIPRTAFQVYADTDPSLDQGGQRGLMQALPSYFTSIGLIFTFVGLVVALYFAARGFRSGDIEEARGAILNLLNAASFKFLTSVAALTGALLISLVGRWGLSRLRQEAEATVGTIEGYLSLWREAQGAGGGSRDPMAGVTERLDVLVAGVAALTKRLDALLDSRQAGISVIHDAAE